MESRLDFSARISERRNLFDKTTSHAPRCNKYLRKAVQLLDHFLRGMLRIYDFSSDVDCLLRIAVVQLGSKMTPPDIAAVGRSDKLIELHFWNDHFGPLLAGKPACARAALIRRHLRLSLHFLAEYLVAHPEISAPIIHARVVMPIGNRLVRLKAIAEMYGFTPTIPSPSGLSPIHDFFENFLVRVLVWTFNPATPHRRRLQLERADLWIDRDTLVDRYLLCANEKTHCDQPVPESCGSRV